MSATKWIKILVIALGFVTGCAVAPPTPTPTPLPTPTPVPVQFDANRAYEHNRVLAETIGARVAGSENGMRAGEYIAQQFSSYGYTIAKQSFTFEGWRDLGTRVQMITPETKSIDARPLQYSPAGTMEAELVAVNGVGSESDFAQAQVKGKIALVQRGTLAFSDKALNAQKAGAVAVIIYNNAPNDFSGTLRDRISIPVLGTSGRSGEMLLDLLGKGAVRIKIESDTRITQSTGRNIIGTIRGTGDGVVVLGGHYDSVELGKGGNDNGSGTAVLLELARVLASKSLKHTIVLIAFDAEELGLIGSRYYVAGLSDAERKRIVAMLNFDMLGGGSGGLLLDGNGRAGNLAQDAARRLGIAASPFQLGSNASSDHASFRNAGIDAVFFMRNYDLLHTPQDDFSQVRAEYLDQAGRVAVQVIEALDGARE